MTSERGYGEPWVVRVVDGTLTKRTETLDCQGDYIMDDEPYYPTAVTPERQERIAFCLNELAGIPSTPGVVKGLVEAAIAALEHVTELRDAWQRGSLEECDGKGGTRSNRNFDVEVSLRSALAGVRGEGE